MQHHKRIREDQIPPLHPVIVVFEAFHPAVCVVCNKIEMSICQIILPSSDSPLHG